MWTYYGHYYESLRIGKRSAHLAYFATPDLLFPDPCIAPDRQFSQIKQKAFCARLSDYLDYVLVHPVRTAWERVGLIDQRESPLL